MMGPRPSCLVVVSKLAKDMPHHPLPIDRFPRIWFDKPLLGVGIVYIAWYWPSLWYSQGDWYPYIKTSTRSRDDHE